MGSSTGNMLVDNEKELHAVFKHVPALIALHCEDDPMIKAKQLEMTAQYGDAGLNATHHPQIRHRAACYASSSKAVASAKLYGTRIHVLHISTAEELALFSNELPLKDKKITAEAFIHHLWFSEEDYEQCGNFIKWNPAVKPAIDREAILQQVIDGRIDVIATDQAPHTLAEKQLPYLAAPSGGLLVQHSIQAMFELAEQGKIKHAQLVRKMSHSVAELFRIETRGFVREGYQADLVLVEKKPHTVHKDNLLYKCGWSPLEGTTFSHTIHTTLVNGHPVWYQGKLDYAHRGERLRFVLNF